MVSQQTLNGRSNRRVLKISVQENIVMRLVFLRELEVSHRQIYVNLSDFAMLN